MNRIAHNGDIFLVRNQNYGEQVNASSAEKTEKETKEGEERLNETSLERNLKEQGRRRTISQQPGAKKNNSPNKGKKLSTRHTQVPRVTSCIITNHHHSTYIIKKKKREKYTSYSST